MKIKLDNFVFEYFTYHPYKGALLLFLIALITAPILNSIWLASHCDYQNLKGNPNIDWEIEVGSSSSRADPISHEDDFPQQSYPLYSDVRSTFTAVTTWYQLGVPMVDVYRVAFFKPLAHHGLICDLGYEESLVAKTADFTGKLVKNIFWFYILVCLVMNVQAYHNHKNLQSLYTISGGERFPKYAAHQVSQYVRPLTIEDYLDQFTLAFALGVIWRVVVLVFFISGWVVDSLFIF